MSDHREVLVAIDVGTSGARAVAFDLDGDRLLEARRPYADALAATWLGRAGRPRDWRSAALGARSATSVRGSGPGRRVRGHRLTGQCPSVVLVDRPGDRALGPGLIYRDNRATAEADEIRARFGRRGIHARTGHLPAAFHIAPKLLWLRRHGRTRGLGPFAASSHATCVVLALTGEAVTDGTHAAATLVYDLRRDGGTRRCWPTSACRRPSSRRLRSLGRGRRHPAAARRRPGRPAGIDPVVLGGADSQACALGAGVVAPGPVSRDGRLVDLPECRGRGAPGGPRGDPLPACRRPRT